jgi:hypothetical protein
MKWRDNLLVVLREIERFSVDDDQPLQTDVVVLSSASACLVLSEGCRNAKMRDACSFIQMKLSCERVKQYKLVKISVWFNFCGGRAKI